MADEDDMNLSSDEEYGGSASKVCIYRLVLRFLWLLVSFRSSCFDGGLGFNWY